jgi:hypothetical protein
MQAGLWHNPLPPCHLESVSHWVDQMFGVKLVHKYAQLNDDSRSATYHTLFMLYSLAAAMLRGEGAELNHDVSTLPSDPPRRRPSCASFLSLPYSQINIMLKGQAKRCYNLFPGNSYSGGPIHIILRK